MKMKWFKYIISIGVTTVVVIEVGCDGMKAVTTQLQASQSSTTPPPATITPSGSQIVAGQGASISGTGALSVTNYMGAPIRIVNGMMGLVNPVGGNFKNVMTQVSGNLPLTTDATIAGGFDQVQLLIYAACTDMTTGTNPVMSQPTYFNVNASLPISGNQAALVAAGVKILDQYSAGLASRGPTSVDITNKFTQQVKQLAADSTLNSKMAFVSVCMAANEAGFMLGF